MTEQFGDGSFNRAFATITPIITTAVVTLDVVTIFLILLITMIVVVPLSASECLFSLSSLILAALLAFSSIFTFMFMCISALELIFVCV